MMMRERSGIAMHDTYILLVVEYLCRLIFCILTVGLGIIGALIHSEFLIIVSLTFIGLLLILTTLQIIGIISLARKVGLYEELKK
jgi:hypothetical protein